MANGLKPRIIVVGGGAAGMMAAGVAAAAGARVLLLEKMKQPGRKLAITGKGRCNLTNICEIREFIDHFGRNGKFLRQTFVKVMRSWLKKSGATTRLDSPVESLLIQDEKLTGVMVNGEKFPAAVVILATGGASYPKTGSTGDGYLLAASAGHTIITPQPALVPLIGNGNILPEAYGLSLRNVGVRLLINRKKRKDIFGEVMFTDDGVSGPTVLTLSGMAVAALKENSEVELILDLKPALDENRLDARLLRDFQRRGKENIASILRGLMPRELTGTCLKLIGIEACRQGHQVTSEERRRLRRWLKEWHLPISGHRPLAEAIITAGGVDLKEINPRTMASHKLKNLFIAGELLDIQADTGGYNLQAAFSTGHLAGYSAAQLINQT